MARPGSGGVKGNVKGRPWGSSSSISITFSTCKHEHPKLN
ncbi:MAG: hypothetical protein JWO94_3383 [Verrucomicrobiaceae bacterium]|nr:hypothetical protein [Verrucomicrobiaceae bacterium]